MFYSEHNPPHFHAEYQGTEGVFNFKGELLYGNIKSKIALRLIKKWAVLRQKELDENWENIIEKTVINKIKPLE